MKFLLSPSSCTFLTERGREESSRIFVPDPYSTSRHAAGVFRSPDNDQLFILKNRTQYHSPLPPSDARLEQVVGTQHSC